MVWQIVFPISDLQLNVSNYNIGNLTFHQANTYNVFNYWRIPNIQPIRNSITTVYANKVIVEANNITGNTWEEALHNVIFELEKIFDLFSLVYYRTSSKIIISEPNLTEDFYVLVKDLNTNNETFHLKHSDFLKQLTVKQNDIAKITNFQNFFPFIGKSVGAYSEIEYRISDCLHWCRKANMDARPEDRLLNYIIGLEHLLLYNKRTSNKQRTLCERSAKILALSKTQRSNIQTEIKEAWNLRSDIVHEAYSNLTPKEVKLIEKIRFYTYIVAHNLSKLSKKRKTLKGVISLNDKKIEERRTKRLQKLNNLHVRINYLPRSARMRTKFYRCSAAIENQNGISITEMDMILKIYDDFEYMFLVGTGKNFTNTNINISSNDILSIKGTIPVLKKQFVLSKIDFEDDIILQLPNKIQNNQNISFIAYDFKIQ